MIFVSLDFFYANIYFFKIYLKIILLSLAGNPLLYINMLPWVHLCEYTFFVWLFLLILLFFCDFFTARPVARIKIYFIFEYFFMLIMVQ